MVVLADGNHHHMGREAGEVPCRRRAEGRIVVDLVPAAFYADVVRAEEVARADALRRFLVKPKQEGEQQEVSNRFVELSGVACKVFAISHKDKAPIRTSCLAHNLGVHQVSEANASRRKGRGNRNIVKGMEELHLCLSGVKHKCHDYTHRSPVRGKSGIANELRAAVGHGANGQHHFRVPPRHPGSY